MGKCPIIINNKPYKNIYEKGEDNKLHIKKDYKIPKYQYSIECLKCHNEYRKKHKAKDLILDNDLAIYAQNHADELAQKNEVFHSTCRTDKGEIIGESIYSSMKEITGKDFADALYKDKENYNFEKPKYLSKASRFTQLVWKGTEKVGFGFTLNKNSKQFFAVAIYYPAGNQLGSYEENVENDEEEKKK